MINTVIMKNKYDKYNWNEESYAVFVSDLKLLADDGYKKFQSNLVPNIDNILGIRVPVLRSLAKDIAKGNWREFFKSCRDDFYEETMVQGFVLNNLQIELEELIEYMDRFIVKIDNWATCDTFCSGMKIIKKNREVFLPYIQTLVSSQHDFTIRTGLVLLLAHYIIDDYIDIIFNISNSIRHDSYYVKMANAWLVATCYAKYRDKTMSFLKNNCLDTWTHNKSIQKIFESKTTSQEDKIILKYLKR